jgi:hypothetical protein
MRRSLSGTLIGSAIPLQLIASVLPPAAALGFRWIELSWILEDNLPMRRILERLGAPAYKTYRVYGKQLGSPHEALAAHMSSTYCSTNLPPQAPV